MIAKLIQLVIQWLLPYLSGKIYDAINSYLEKSKRDQAVKQAIIEYKKAPTKEDQERAFDDLVRALNR
jgi:hypothetical protein